MMRFLKTGLLSIGVILAGCATYRATPVVWRNSSAPQRNYVRDSQECEVISTALVNGNFSGLTPVYRLAVYNVQWNRCMVGRNWRQVAVKDTSTSPSAPVLSTLRPLSGRWKPISGSEGHRVYLDTAQVIRGPNGLLGVWVMAQFDTVQVVQGLRFQRLSMREDFDCARRRARTLSLAVEEPNGVQESEAVPSPVFRDVPPESADEDLLNNVCRVLAEKSVAAP